MRGKMKRLVVIESPYAGDVEENVKYARTCLLDSIRRGESPIASHLLYTQVLDDLKEDERSLGIGLGIEWVLQAKAMPVFYLDKGMSKGMLAAMSIYAKNNIKPEFRYTHNA